MRNITFLLAFLGSISSWSTSNAQESTYEAKSPHTVAASISNNSSGPNKQDGLGTQIAIYSLIIGIYTLYGLKHKA